MYIIKRLTVPAMLVIALVISGCSQDTYSVLSFYSVDSRVSTCPLTVSVTYDDKTETRTITKPNGGSCINDSDPAMANFPRISRGNYAVTITDCDGKSYTKTYHVNPISTDAIKGEHFCNSYAISFPE